MKTIAKHNMPRKTLVLFLSVAMSMALLFTLLAAGDAGRVRAQTTGDCSNGIAVPSPSANPGLVSDCEALLAGRDTLAGTASLNWSSNVGIRGWDGVRVSYTLMRVTQLDFLHSVEFEIKTLTGRLPPELGRLTHLENVYISNSDTICEGDNCREIEDDERHQLTGPIPPELGNLTNLERLWLYDNELTGNIPAELGNLSSLNGNWDYRGTN